MRSVSQEIILSLCCLAVTVVFFSVRPRGSLIVTVIHVSGFLSLWHCTIARSIRDEIQMDCASNLWRSIESNEFSLISKADGTLFIDHHYVNFAIMPVYMLRLQLEQRAMECTVAVWHHPFKLVAKHQVVHCKLHLTLGRSSAVRKKFTDAQFLDKLSWSTCGDQQWLGSHSAAFGPKVPLAGVESSWTHWSSRYNNYSDRIVNSTVFTFQKDPRRMLRCCELMNQADFWDLTQWL